MRKRELSLLCCENKVEWEIQMKGESQKNLSNQLQNIQDVECGKNDKNPEGFCIQIASKMNLIPTPF